MDIRQPAFLFLKAVFVFGRFGGRRSRRDSFLSFQSLLADAFRPCGRGSVQSPIWFQRVASGLGVSPACRRWTFVCRRRTPSSRRPGARKHSVPVRVHSGVMTCGSRRLPASRPTSRWLTAWSNHH